MSATDELLDKVAITELIHRYQLAIDSHAAARWAGTFTEDGASEPPFGHAKGTEQLIGAMASRISLPYDVSRSLGGYARLPVDREEPPSFPCAAGRGRSPAPIMPSKSRSPSSRLSSSMARAWPGTATRIGARRAVTARTTASATTSGPGARTNEPSTSLRKAAAIGW